MSKSAAFLRIFVLQQILSGLNVFGAYCSGKPDAGERVNTIPIHEELKPRFIRSVPNAMLFEAGPLNATFPIVHIWGNPYEIGFAQGTLRKEAIREFISKTYKYLVTEFVSSMDNTKIPTAIKVKIVEMGIDKALDWTAKVTAPFTSQAYFDEVRGISEASGVDYDLLYRINMFPELIKASCSFFGAWGTSVAKKGHSYQLRALDFDTDGPFKDYPQLTVYHPTDGGHPYAQVSWPGNVGALSGFSQQQLAISEIGVSYPDDSFGQGTDNTPPEKVHGQPWMYILRDILQFDDSLEAAKSRISSANRTCNLILGVGDGKSGQVSGVQFSGYVSTFYSDSDLLPVDDAWHPQVQDVVYNGMDWLCPSYTSVLGEQLKKYHGSIDEEVVIRNILPTVQTGSLHVAVYDLTRSLMHLSFYRPDGNNNADQPLNAYERQFTRLHMQSVFSQEPPSV
mmetsp:Transcript_4788/g.6599  ORF Transcript_4788/g.6599 Transcript_4788/m.6599 type:complete len:452 (+) Transcript_4788:41-1396(+)|eukprot:CAMPEP_0170065304 /NCGR_PEP_ID=MMETSP0019_2-20121128/5439_1 /TAXON_ID=98059 /ORGANISM="Dinobryon sp., Strain UTEXLB2267" /LENGTH=451 /DNA_ID=CAMNT_0010272135 /DNA_START=21 /DNA_END=1376 /DNA_ORIENTATION=+